MFNKNANENLQIGAPIEQHDHMIILCESTSDNLMKTELISGKKNTSCFVTIARPFFFFFWLGNFKSNVKTQW